MDRNLHPKHIPSCKKNIAIVNQYMWPQKDTNTYSCTNGISHPIYDCQGQVSYSLPLEDYPPVDGIHPQISMTRRMHFNYRQDPHVKIPLRNRAYEGYSHPPSIQKCSGCDMYNR